MNDSSNSFMSFVVELFSKLGELFEKKLGTDLFDSVGNFIAHLTPIFLLAVTTYIVLIFWEYRTSGFDDLVNDLSKKMLFWLILTAFAFNANNYIHIANVIYNAPNEISSWFLNSAEPLNNNFFVQTAIPLDALLNQINKYYDKLDWSRIGQIFNVSICYILISIVGYSFIGATFGLYMICRVLLAVTIMIGPVFVGFLFFPMTRQWGINWIGQIINYLTTAVLYMITVILFLTFMKGEFEAFIYKFNHPNIPSITALLDGLFAFMLCLTLIFLLVLWKVPTIASSLIAGASAEGMFSGGLKAISTTGAAAKNATRGTRQGIAAIRSNFRKNVTFVRDKIRSNNIKPGSE